MARMTGKTKRNFCKYGCCTEKTGRSRRQHVRIIKRREKAYWMREAQST